MPCKAMALKLSVGGAVAFVFIAVLSIVLCLKIYGRRTCNVPSSAVQVGEPDSETGVASKLDGTDPP